MKYRVDPVARKELNDAAAFDERENPGLTNRLVDEFLRVVRLLIDNPELGIRIGNNRRVITLKRFPFRLVYAVENSVIRIIAIAHQKRRPDYWRGRVEEPRPGYAPLPQAA
jgi:toxin ParE1/3/4